MTPLRYAFTRTPKCFRDIAEAEVCQLNFEQPGQSLPLFAVRSVAEAEVLVAAMSGQGFVHAPVSAQKEK